MVSYYTWHAAVVRTTLSELRERSIFRSCTIFIFYRIFSYPIPAVPTQTLIFSDSEMIPQNRKSLDYKLHLEHAVKTVAERRVNGTIRRSAALDYDPETAFSDHKISKKILLAKNWVGKS